MLQILTPNKALNKAYLKEKVSRYDIETFKTNFKTLLSKIKEGESEEHHKYPVVEFLKDTWYKDNNYINTKGRTDFVIHNGKSATDSAGVILEFKSPTNASEMITANKPNKKALQELVFYYLRERIEHNNIDIKHLIITNINEWYIFDEVWFEKNVYQNYKFKKGYEAYIQNGRNTHFFYDSIARPELDAIDATLSCAYVNLRQYEKFVRNDDSTDDKKLIPLYKILSPTHLLKQSFANDSNSLDTKFYTELLHIIGLEEVKDGSKKLIRRKATPDSASLLESAIIKLEDKESLRNISGLSSFGATRSEQLFGVALELCITWVNRILFIKLLEGQLITYNTGNQEYKFLNADYIHDYDELNDLFFSVLAERPATRRAHVKDKFARVPYLNSSLFDRTSLEREAIEVDVLDNRALLTLLSSTVLKNEQGKRKTGQLTTLQYLFQFLDAYDFSSDGGEEIQEENKNLINASVLGLIFEKINGYKDGSFFTPGFITMYMCRETIRHAVLQKFKEEKNWECETLDQLYDKIQDKTEANNIINNLRICDPAVGSGHFLVSALNEIIAIKSELQILQDRQHKTLRDYNVEVVNDELVVTDEEGNLLDYNPRSKESQRIQEALFHEKETIIENCLFGVDINPNSVKICRLRLWIELLKNTYYTTDSNFIELETLPNIDINIKCGNSLISRFALDADLGQALKKSKWSIDSYRIAVQTYRSAETKEEKRQMEQLIEDIKGNFRTEIGNNDPKIKKLQKINTEYYQKYQADTLFAAKLTKEQKKHKELLEKEIEKLDTSIKEIKSNKIYENAFEWRFEFPEVLDNDGRFVGFDVVIGNPPYIYNRDLSEQVRNIFHDKYNFSDDLYTYFIVDGIKILRINGLISYITPNTYLTLSTKETTREILLSYSNLTLSYSGFCFADAYVETQIFFLKKHAGSDEDIVTFADIVGKRDVVCAPKNIFVNNVFKRFFWPIKQNLNIHFRINSNLIHLVEMHKNVLQGKKNFDRTVLENYKSHMNVNDITLLGLICNGEQGLVTGNNSKYVANIVDDQSQSKIDQTFLELLNKHRGTTYDLSDLINNRPLLYSIAEELKMQTQKPSLFGKFFNYKTITKDAVVHYRSLSEMEQKNGTDIPIYIYYSRGNSEGYVWYVPYTEAIIWTKEAVKELKEGVVTNSRWQGESYFATSGFGWVDYFTDGIKAFYVEEGVYSKNIVKLHSSLNQLQDKIIVAYLNSKFISYYIKTFITSTHTLQINDGRLIPLVIPDSNTYETIEGIVDKILAMKKQNPSSDTHTLENEIDQLVYQLYGLTEEEIKIVEGTN
jgi:adenine-specific DNA-methyltransferase